MSEIVKPADWDSAIETPFNWRMGECRLSNCEARMSKWENCIFSDAAEICPTVPLKGLEKPMGYLIICFAIIFVFNLKIVVAEEHKGIFLNLSWNNLSDNFKTLNLEKPYHEGYGGGFSLDIRPSGIFSVLLDLQYARRGNKEIIVYKDHLSEKIGETEIVTLLDYVSIPILLKWKVNALPVKPYIALGPSISIPFRGRRSETKELFGITVFDSTTDITNRLSFINFALNIGGGIDVHIKKIVLFTHFGYCLGFTDYLENGDPHIKNKSIELRAGVRIK